MATRFPAGHPMVQSASNSTEGGTLNAPRYGTVVPKRIFVGGISASTTEAELHELFSRFGVVTNAKIILDRAGVSKGYGFVTFDTEEDAQRAQASASNLTLRDRRLNIAPAIKKQPFTRVYDPTQSVPNGTILYHNGIPYTYHNGMAFFITPEYQYSGQTPAYPVIYQPSVYYPQHAFQYQNVSCFQPWICTVSSHRKESDWLQVASQWSPWRWNSSSNTSGAPTTYPYSAASDEYYDPAIVEASTEVGGARRDGGGGAAAAAGTLWGTKARGGCTKRGDSPLLPTQLCRDSQQPRPPPRQRRYTAPPEAFLQTPPWCDGAEAGQRGSSAGVPDCHEPATKFHWRDCLFDTTPNTPTQTQVCP
ncbi:protein boule-like isoform X2 [Ornithodoros turicata]|uniref:protein boule-like isoform X2 n=1 Tax=Ornithodoros turicata TaxID=34597 RepID=UPI0031395251